MYHKNPRANSVDLNEMAHDEPHLIGIHAVFIFIHFYLFLSSFSLSLGDGPIQTEILSQRAVKPKTTKRPTFIFGTKVLTVSHVKVAPMNMGFATLR